MAISDEIEDATIAIDETTILESKATTNIWSQIVTFRQRIDRHCQY